MEWLEGEGALKGRDKVILHEHAVQGILHLQASKRLENTQGCVYQTAQQKKRIYGQHRSSKRVVASPNSHNHFVWFQIRTDCFKITK